MIVNDVMWQSDEALERFVAITDCTCLVALDHALASLRLNNTYRKRAEYMAFLSEKIQRAEREVAKCQ